MYFPFANVSGSPLFSVTNIQEVTAGYEGTSSIN